MKKGILLLSLIYIGLASCSINRQGTYTHSLFKTKGDKVVITGIVYDTEKTNRVLPGVAIKSTDTTFLTSTDRNGQYKLEVKPGKTILRASYIGYLLSSTMPLNLVKGDSLVIDFVLKESNERTIN
ncbi:carboxypeptidase-like regulatory domain-containing protein [Pedobacter sp. MR2016-19]|uniref:carboxypeptidase-like regulatory domain-containing protein n=1 Tax=Pedobacter sp. MR2016-19 TaxID=2780089 RepID=UPI001875E5BD|nr:carboxypeptidase-like regulatory domain-containing protein [Pedobacter sp. MR2016-19]MBE5318143.1 carboxypeptidase-like regulatory domain-containing protein [Pedobacter sp. MR2016-19]